VLPVGLRRDTSGVWQLRIGVPDDIRPYWPKRPDGSMAVDAYRRSLRTRDRGEAVLEAHRLHAEYGSQFAALRERHRPRTTQPTERLVEHLCQRMLHELLDGDDARRASGDVLAAVPLSLAELGIEALPNDPLDRAEVVAEVLGDWTAALGRIQAAGDFRLAEDFAKL